MGLYNLVKFSTKCPKCGELISDFQTKDGTLSLSEVEFYEVDNFYSFCENCGTSLDYTLKPEIRKLITIDYYNLRITQNV
jgi:hypothetical protein